MNLTASHESKHVLAMGLVGGTHSRPPGSLEPGKFPDLWRGVRMLLKLYGHSDLQAENSGTPSRSLGPSPCLLEHTQQPHTHPTAMDTQKVQLHSFTSNLEEVPLDESFPCTNFCSQADTLGCSWSGGRKCPLTLSTLPVSARGPNSHTHTP